MNRQPFTCLELLELRIAPASITVSYTDVDGDQVRIKASNAHPDAPPLDSGDLSVLGGGIAGQQLAVLNLSDPGFTGANITFSVTKTPGGNGLADVGQILATGVSLGVVSVKGDLGVIDVGTGSGEALKGLTARSMGLHGLATQGGGGELVSDILGAVGFVTVNGDLEGAFLNIQSGGKLGKLTIRGSLIGGSTATSGFISSTGGIGSIFIGSDIVGGAGGNSGGIDTFGTIGRIFIGGSMHGGAGLFLKDVGGVSHEGQVFATGNIGPVFVRGNLIGQEGSGGASIRTNGDIASITVGGSVIGGAGTGSGQLSGEAIGPVKIGGDIIGGSGAATGAIEAYNTLGNVTIGGSILGGPGYVSGFVTANGDIGKVKLAGSLVGGSISGTEASTVDTGLIASLEGRIASIFIGGSVLAGIDTSSIGDLVLNGSISARNDIGALTIKGSVIGSSSDRGETRVHITAGGQKTPSGNTDLAIGKIVIGGRVERADILAGFDGTEATNGNAQIGTVTVGGDWRASSLVAGIRDVDADGFGDADDIVIPTPPVDAILSRIASVSIKGIITGTGSPAGDHYGFTAQQIGAFRFGGITLSLTGGTDAPVLLAPVTGDVTLREVPL